ncbi:MAG TPA: cytochrome c biogenesis protein CcdA [Acidimicrobiia bacterium]|nr:cytochrome c biogenesis protein CcdA [Acidimicrobiia bacterium]
MGHSIETVFLGAVTEQNVNVLIAFGGGIVSFLSPCVLPIVPGYLSLITGISVGELREGDPRYLVRIAINTGLFVLGFTVVFTLLFLSTTAVSDALFQNQETLTRVAGALIIVMAAYLAGTQLVMAPALYGEARFHPNLQRFGPFAAPVAGAAFGLGWTPCIGPVLGSVLAVASTRGDTARGAVLLIAYSIGLGVPFLAVGLALGRLEGALGWFKRHSKAITLVSAAVLAAFGFVLLFDRLTWVTARLSELWDALGLRSLVNV